MSSVDVIAYPGQKTREEWLVEVSAGPDSQYASRHGIVISYLISHISYYAILKHGCSFLIKTTMSL